MMLIDSILFVEKSVNVKLGFLDNLKCYSLNVYVMITIDGKNLIVASSLIPIIKQVWCLYASFDRFG